MSSSRPQSAIDNHPSAMVWLLSFAALLLTHFTLLRLPYFWDETGYYIPAARDLLLNHSLIPTSTLTNAHPPLVMAWLAVSWRLFGYSPLVTRIAMLAIAAFALTAVFRLSQRIANTSVAIASTICTALYPVFFAQSSLAHLDLAAAALILWGLCFHLGDRDLRDRNSQMVSFRAQRGTCFNYNARSRTAAVLFFALACLAKETAALVPVSLFAWELILRAIGNRKSAFGNAVATPNYPITRSFKLLASLIPLAAWFAFHYARTGHVFGNPEFFRYNLGGTLNPLRFFAALALRLWHLLGYMNMFLLTLATVGALLLPPRPGRDRIAPGTQAVLYVLIFAHVLALSVLGGAVLARYLLPVYPLAVVVGINTLWRRLPGWPAFAAAICAGFIVALLINPPYRFAPEDNLAYADYVRLHEAADVFVAQHYAAQAHESLAPDVSIARSAAGGPPLSLPGLARQGGDSSGDPKLKVETETILTAWPASDELTRPWLGYVPRVVPVLRIEDFSLPQILAATEARARFRAALVFSTKYQPPLLLRLPGWERLQTRFFGYHRDLPPEVIARLLGGRVVLQQRRAGLWVAVIEMDYAENALHSQPPRHRLVGGRERIPSWTQSELSSAP
ncbi:MAG: ArnT family glycosyltransferase [Terriglobales bacterium]